MAVGLYRVMVQCREALETGSDAWQQLALPARDICSVQRLHRGVIENNASEPFTPASPNATKNLAG